MTTNRAPSTRGVVAEAATSPAGRSEGDGDADVLLVEDDARLRDVLVRGMREMGFRPAAAASAEQAIRLMDRRPCPTVIVDLNLPGAGGLDFLRAVRRRWPRTQAIILTGFGDLAAAREAIHLEVVDFLTKPCALGDLEIALGRAAERLNRQAAADGGPAPRIAPPDDGGLAADLAFAPREGSAALSIEDVERRAILAVLEKHGQNRATAAAELGISVRKLYYRLAQYQKQGHDVS